TTSLGRDWSTDGNACEKADDIRRYDFHSGPQPRAACAPDAARSAQAIGSRRDRTTGGTAGAGGASAIRWAMDATAWLRQERAGDGASRPPRGSWHRHSPHTPRY